MDELKDPIMEEIRRIREEIAARHNYDIDSIMREIREHERESMAKGVKFVSLPRRAPIQKPANAEAG